MSRFSAIVCLGSFAACTAACFVQTPAALKTSNPEERGDFIAVDTSRLMGLPDSHEVLGVENSFPHLSFTRPVDVTHACDGSNRSFVVEQDGMIRVLTNDLQTLSR